MTVIVNPEQLVWPVCVSAVTDGVVGAVTLRQFVCLGSEILHFTCPSWHQLSISYVSSECRLVDAVYCTPDAGDTVCSLSIKYNMFIKTGFYILLHFESGSAFKSKFLTSYVQLFVSRAS